MFQSSTNFYMRCIGGTALIGSILINAAILAGMFALIMAFAPGAQAATQASVATQSSWVVYHHTIEIDGIEIAYREAGDTSNPTLLLLHCFR